MFRASSAHLQEDTVVYMQHIVLSLSMRVRGRLSVHSLSENSSFVPTGHQELSQRVTVPYAACVQLSPPEDEHLRLETCRGEYYFMNK
jgi:hypothetical protein